MAATGVAPNNIGFDFSNYARNEFLGARLGAQAKSELDSACLLHPTWSSANNHP